ncbi:MAG: sulfatase [Spirochaetes bacterium]|nr:sulfatase [Spirochaetota bacterium]
MEKRPNLLLAIADDQSWPHTGAYGCRFVKTPAFDRVAREGVLFQNAFCPSPSCAPSRAALLTGRNPWQLNEGVNLWGTLPSKFAAYPDLLEAAGYHIGHTYKGWGPGSIEDSGRTRNPAGPAYNRRTNAPPSAKMSKNDYTANFQDFLADRPAGAPFCFWYGAKEPHRAYEKGSGLRAGKSLASVEVPPFLPDCEEVRSDLLDYALEIEWFDAHLGRMLAHLEAIGELENTLVVVTADNGFPFPRAKANLYELGMHVPLALRWGARVPGGRVLTDHVSFIDLAPTFLEAAGLVPSGLTGRSLLPILVGPGSGRVDPLRDHVVTGRERHAFCRAENLGYPMRCLRTDDFVYIRNFEAERWPAGDPPAWGDIDASPTKHYLVRHRDDASVKPLFELAFGKRPGEELYAVKDGYANLRNLAADPNYGKILSQLRERLTAILAEQNDPRLSGGGDFERYRYYGENLKTGTFTGLEDLKAEGLLE